MKLPAFGAVVAVVVLPATVRCLSAQSPLSTRRQSFTKLAPATAAAFVLLGEASSAQAALENYQSGPEGIKYLVTQKGTGTTKPQRAQEVQTKYTLYLNGFPDEVEDSYQIDSTKKFYGEQPFKVRAGVKQVIRGWDLSLMDMVEGEKRRIFIPYQLGYGDKKQGPVPPKANLYFEVELVSIEPMRELTEEAKKWLDEHPL